MTTNYDNKWNDEIRKNPLIILIILVQIAEQARY